MCGLTPKLLKVLCENTFDGGLGYKPWEVGEQTLDQIYFLLGDRDNFRSTRKKHRIRKQAAEQVAIGEDGIVKAVAEDGTPIKLRKTGKSKTQMLWEAETKKKEEAKKKEERLERKRKRKRRNG